MLNNTLFKSIPEGHMSFISVGRKAMQFLSQSKRSLIASFSINDRVQYHEVLGICELISKLYLEGEIDGVEILFQKFINTLTYRPFLQRVLPMGGFYDVFNQMLKSANLGREYFQRDPRGLLFEPDVKRIIDHIGRIFFEI
jgi:F-type H+-transporting ATPase subunit gamma